MKRGLGLASLLGVMLFTGCLFGGPDIGTRSFAVRAVPDANDRSPIPVEMVLVRNEQALEALSALTASEWFDRRGQLIRDGADSFDSRLWEFVPGQRVPRRDLPFDDRDGVALLLFARYLTPGAHRARVDAMERFTLVLGRTEFTVEPAP